MAEPPTTVNSIRERLQASRLRLGRDADSLGASLDMPSRLRREVASHPIKWAALAIAGGIVAARVLPAALGLVRVTASRRLLGTALSTLAPFALKAGLDALASRHPEFTNGPPLKPPRPARP